jgi:hypothetical protein
MNLIDKAEHPRVIKTNVISEVATGLNLRSDDMRLGIIPARW